jgi:hypothetical protein|nr:MAG TPA: hypothetical protein [Caudoviricetes sp.]
MGKVSDLLVHVGEGIGVCFGIFFVMENVPGVEIEKECRD